MPLASNAYVLCAGNGVVTFSTYTKNNSAGTTNDTHIVVASRIVVGNKNLYTSVFGNPAIADIGADGSISPANQDAHSSARADNVSNLITLTAGQSVRMVEVNFKTIAFSLNSLSTGGGHYSRAIF